LAGVETAFEEGCELVERFLLLEVSDNTFRDCKDLLHLTKPMNKNQALLEQMIALSLLAY